MASSLTAGFSSLEIAVSDTGAEDGSDGLASGAGAASLTSAFVDIFSFIGNTGVDVLGFTPLSIFIGAGLSSYLVYVAAKWLIGK